MAFGTSARVQLKLTVGSFGFLSKITKGATIPAACSLNRAKHTTDFPKIPFIPRSFFPCFQLRWGCEFSFPRPTQHSVPPVYSAPPSVPSQSGGMKSLPACCPSPSADSPESLSVFFSPQEILCNTREVDEAGFTENVGEV